MATNTKIAQIGGVVLQKSQENRLDEILGTFAKTEAGYLRYGEFIHLIIDRAMVNNKHTFSLFHEFYNKGVEPDTTEAPDFSGKNEKKMSKQKFAYIITKIASKLFPGDKNPIETIFKTILIEKPLLNLKDAIEPPKVLIHDEMNKRILNEQVISGLCEYEIELQRVYTLYISDNLRYNKMMLTWREISIQNKKMSSVGLVKLLREADIIPGLISPEQVSEVCSKVTPPITHAEHGFFTNGKIPLIYDKEYSVNDENKIDGDPHYYLHEFQLILARIALETVGKAQEKKDDERAIRQFLGQNLLIRSNSEIAEKKELPSINKGFIRRLAASYKDPKPRKSGAPEEQKIENKVLEEEEEEFNTDPESLNIDMNDMFKKLDKELPKIPEEIEITAQNPAPFEKEPVQIGPTVPVSKEKGGQEKKPAQKAQPKKKDKDEREIRFADVPPPRQPLANEKIIDYLEAVDDNDVKEENDPGTMSHIEVAPTLIKEVLYPPEMPIEVSTFLEAAIVSHNSSNFTLALKNYEKAKQEWANIVDELPEAILLFFDYSKGLVYESAGKDDFAFQQFLVCRNHVEKIPFNSPDRALPYCGLGSILYKTYDYQWALRCFLKALDIREKILSPESVDTATVYNNVGCCMIFLDRMQEANSYFELAHEIFDLMLGPFHYRTITAKRNMSKVKKYSFKTVAPYSVLWKTLQYNKYPVKKKKKKGKKK